MLSCRRRFRARRRRAWSRACSTTSRSAGSIRSSRPPMRLWSLAPTRTRPRRRPARSSGTVPTSGASTAPPGSCLADAAAPRQSALSGLPPRTEHSLDAPAGALRQPCHQSLGQGVVQEDALPPGDAGARGEAGAAPPAVAPLLALMDPPRYRTKLSWEVTDVPPDRAPYPGELGPEIAGGPVSAIQALVQD